MTLRELSELMNNGEDRSSMFDDLGSLEELCEPFGGIAKIIVEGDESEFNLKLTVYTSNQVILTFLANLNFQKRSQCIA